MPSNRVTLFDLDGELVRTFQAEARFEGYGSPRPIEALLVGGSAAAVPYNPPLGTIERVWAPFTIGPVERPRRTEVFEVSRPPGLLVPPVMMRGALPFPIPPLFAIAPDGSRIDRVGWVDEDANHLEIRSFAPTGDVAREFSIPYRARLTPESFVERQIDALVPGVESALSESARLRGESRPRGVRERVREAVAAPRFLPPIDKALIDAEGRLWVRTFSADPTRRRWTVVTNDRISFCVEGLATADIQTAKGDTVWAVEVDQLDVPTLVAYALEDVDASEGIAACGLD